MRTTKDSAYRIYTASTDGIALIEHGRYGRQVWVRCQLRKCSVCAVTGRRLLTGATAYRPLTNAANRMKRISEQFIKESFRARAL